MGRIDDFANNFRQGVRATLFRVEGNIPGGHFGNNQRQFFIKAASMPASTIGVVEVPYLGRRIKLPGDRTFAEWTITVMMDEDNLIREDFVGWMNSIGSHTNIFGENQADILNREDWTFTAMTNNDTDVASGFYEMINCFPTEVGAAEFSYENNDTMAEFTVTLQFDYWLSSTST